MQKKKLVLVGAIIGTGVVILTAVIILLTARIERGSEIVHVRALFSLYEDKPRETLTRFLEEYEQFYPTYEISEEVLPYRDMIEAARNSGTVDLIMLEGADLALFGDPVEPPVPWVGSLFMLYYTDAGMEAAGISETTLTDFDWESFLDEMSGVASRKVVPFALGARFDWPWFAWMQHLSVQAVAGDSVEDMISAIPQWIDLVDRGFVSPEYATRTWAQAVTDVLNNDALFILSDATIITSLLPNQRGALRSIAFPGSRGVSSGWQIGSIYYLVVPETAASPKGAKALIEYLTSVGIRERFFADTGIELFGPDSFRDEVSLLQSVTTGVRDTKFQPLRDWIDSRR